MWLGVWKSGYVLTRANVVCSHVDHLFRIPSSTVCATFSDINFYGASTLHS